MTTNRSCRGQRGFSLIELLAVVAIIGILASILMMLQAAVSQRSAIAKSTDDLEHLEHWLEEYYAEYSHYPNTQGILWEDPDGGGKPPDWADLKAAMPDLNTGLPEGLMKWIENHKEGRYQVYYNEIRPGSALPGHEQDSTEMGFEFGMINWSNKVYTLKDPWGRSYGYEPTSNLQGYNVWSAGEDGVRGTVDDVGNVGFTGEG